MTLFFIVVSLILLISFLCSITEVEVMVQRGQRMGRLFRKYKKHIEKPIAAVLGLNTIANTGGATLAGALLMAAFGSHWLWLFTVAITLAMLFFSEILPRTLEATFSRGLYNSFSV